MVKFSTKNLKKEIERTRKLKNTNNDCDEIEMNIAKVSKNVNSGNIEELIYRTDNKLYFRANVSVSSCNRLVKLLDEYEKEISKQIGESNMLFDEIKPNPLYIYISSYGGSVFNGLFAYDKIRKFKYPIYTVIDGYAASMGSILSLAGHKRLMTENSLSLIHQLSSGMIGKYEEMKDDFENTTELMNKLINIYVERCNGKMTEKEIKKQFKHDKWWNAKLCLEKGLIDEII